LFGSCTKAPFIDGIYSGKQSPHVFIFFGDSTFKYEYRATWYKESSGIWQKRGNPIYLNSFEQRDKIPVEYVKTENDQGKVIINIKVTVSDKPERDYICFPYVNGQSVFDDPKKGSYSFDTEVLVDSIYFLIAKRSFVLRGTGYKMSYNDVKTKTIYPYLLIGESLETTITIIDSLFGYKAFKDERLEIQNGKVLFKGENKKYKLSLKE
jgi:hypothetical protein